MDYEGSSKAIGVLAVVVGVVPICSWCIELGRSQLLVLFISERFAYFESVCE